MTNDERNPNDEIRNPKEFRMTKSETSRAMEMPLVIRASVILSDFVIWISDFLLFGVVNLFAQYVHAIDNADNHGIDRGILQVGRQPRRAALAKHDQFTNPRADTVNRHNRVHPGAELGWIFLVHQLGTQQQQLATAHGGIFLRCDYRTFDSGEEHRGKCDA